MIIPIIAVILVIIGTIILNTPELFPKDWTKAHREAIVFIPCAILMIVFMLGLGIAGLWVLFK